MGKRPCRKAYMQAKGRGLGQVGFTVFLISCKDPNQKDYNLNFYKDTQ